MFDLRKPILGELFFDLLDLLGEHSAENEHFGITLRDGGFLFDVRSEVPHPQATDPVVIEDPTNVLNNVGRSAYKMVQLREKVSELYWQMMKLVMRFHLHKHHEQGGEGGEEKKEENEEEEGRERDSMYVLGDILGLSSDD